MERAVRRHGDVARVLATGSYDDDLAGNDCRYLLEGHTGTPPIIEISDKDYRSFCWPCHALEELEELEEAQHGRSGP